MTNEIGSAFVNAKFDGIFGMGFASISMTDRIMTPIDRLQKQKVIKHRVFCFDLNHKNELTSKNGRRKGSELQIGGCAHKPTVYVPLTKLGYWQFKLSGIIVKKSRGSSLKLCRNVDGCQAIMDTGTSVITGPASDVIKLNKMLGGRLNQHTNEYHIDCAKRTDPRSPTITFMIQGERFKLTAKDYIMQVDVSILFMIFILRHFECFNCFFPLFSFHLCRASCACPALCHFQPRMERASGLLASPLLERQLSSLIWIKTGWDLHPNSHKK